MRDRALAALAGLVLAGLLAQLGSAPPARAQAAGPALTNPVWPFDFPDPSVLVVNGRYHGFRTSGERMPTIVSDDLATWRDAGDALPELPAWSEPGFLWAPAVLPRGDGYVLYYTTRETASGLQCLSRARGTAPDGPFVDTSTEPMICQRSRNGTIDPAPFVDADGTPYLLYKSEGIAGVETSIIWIVQLSADGYDPIGEPVALLREDQAWEAPRIEAPTLVLVHGRYHLFYSGNRWDTEGYAVGHAVCATVRGPCAKPADAPLHAAGGAIAGPGGQDVFADAEGAWWMAHHAWPPGAAGYPQGQRLLHLIPLAFVDGSPVLGSERNPVSLVRAQRVAGADRYATAAALSRARFAPGVPLVTVTTGTDFPDALAGAPAARAGGGPVLLVTPDEVPAATADELARLAPGTVRVLGGPAAVSDAVVERLGGLAGVAVSRVAGQDRAATAAAVSRETFESGTALAFVASGEAAADALAAGGAGAHLEAPVLLAEAETLTAATAAELARLAPRQVIVVGGSARVGTAVEDGLRALLPGAEVGRIAGNDRYATAAALAAAAFPDPVDEVVAATGEHFPDALAAGSLGRPVLLVPPGGTPSAVREQAFRLARDRILVLGGRAAVDDRSFADLDLR